MITNEELVDDVREFSGWIEQYKELFEAYHNTSGNEYSEGVIDALISINTLYKVIFKRTLEE